MKTKLWTGANLLMFAMFVLSTVVQFNDPDAPIWIAVYAAAAVLTALELKRRAPFYAAIALALITIAWSTWWGRNVHDVPFSALVQQWEMKNERIEVAREMYGLLIVSVWMVAISVAAMRRMSGPRTTQGA
jgi:hypothetical protein